MKMNSLCLLLVTFWIIGTIDCSKPMCPDIEWVLIQQRGQFQNSEQFFEKDFKEYEAGFGSKEKEFWIGLKKLSELTSTGKWQLKINILTWTGETYQADFNSFKVLEGPRYELQIAEYDRFSTLPERYLLDSNGQAFSTYDNDQDTDKTGSCSKTNGDGGWWYGKWYGWCTHINLNGHNRNTTTGLKAMRVLTTDGYKYAQETVMQMLQIRK